MGALVVDAADGTVLFERDAQSAFQPASTMKLLIGSAVLSTLGPATTLQTDCFTDGAIAGGALQGNLYVRGGGDPTIDADALDDAARELAAQGVTRLNGAIVADSSAFTAGWYPDGWTIDDLPNDYAAPVTALSFNENSVALHLVPGASAGMPASIAMAPDSSAVTIVNQTLTGDRRAQDSTTLFWPHDSPAAIVVSGTVPAGLSDPDELDAAVRDPALFADDALKRALLARGIQTGNAELRSGTIPAQARNVWTHVSVPMRELVARMWLPSDNFIAESLLEDLGRSTNGPGDTRARGINAESQWLASIGANPATTTIADGSGVSQYDRLSPTTLVAILRADWAGANRQAIFDALPVAGVRGTLKDALTSPALRGNVFAKTGTMSHTRTLAGYITAPGGRTLVFALLINDWMDMSPNATASVRLAQQRFLEAALQLHAPTNPPHRSRRSVDI